MTEHVLLNAEAALLIVRNDRSLSREERADAENVLREVISRLIRDGLRWHETSTLVGTRHRR